MDDAYLTSMMAVGRGGGALSERKCRTCGGFGRDLLGIDGLCDHCRRTAVAAARPGGAGAAATAGAGTKRGRVEFDEDEEGAGGTEGAAAAGARGAGGERVREPTAADIARMLDEADKVADVPTLDVNGVKRLLLGLERAITRNSLARAKYGDEPARFIESEVALDEELKRVRVLAAAPEQYGVLARSDW